jgi:hypothetical protein
MRMDVPPTMQVFMFGHRDATSPLPVVELTVRGASSGPEVKLSLSTRHFIPVASNTTAAAVNTYAQDVQPGDMVTVMANGKPSAGRVVAKRTLLMQGAFNPFTKVIIILQPRYWPWW